MKPWSVLVSISFALSLLLSAEAAQPSCFVLSCYKGLRFNNELKSLFWDKTCQTNVRRYSCGPVTHHLSLCHVLFTQVNAFQIANLVSGANGLPVWRRTKHVGLGKDRSHGPVCPFPRSKAQTPRWPLHPHKPVLLKRRKGSALWPKKHHVEEVNAQFKHRKQATMKITYSRII